MPGLEIGQRMRAPRLVDEDGEHAERSQGERVRGDPRRVAQDA